MALYFSQKNKRLLILKKEQLFLRALL